MNYLEAIVQIDNIVGDIFCKEIMDYYNNINLLQKYFYNKKLNTSDIVSQSYFLKKIGILQRAEILSRKLNFSSKANLYFRLKRLLDDRYMGELFKVIFAQKTKKNFLLGFQ